MHITFHQAELRHDGHVALHPLTLTIQERRVGVIGLNGSGKTTFARLIAGLSRPSAGAVTVDGFDTVKHAETLRGRVGFIFQHPGNQIILPIIADDIALGLKARRLSREQTEAEVSAALDGLGIGPLARRRPHELSGGELQLAALAAVLVTRPGLVIFDEPTNQLDLRNRAQVERAIQGLAEHAIVISHDLALIEGFDRVLVFDRGALSFDGEAAGAIAHYRRIALS